MTAKIWQYKPDRNCLEQENINTPLERNSGFKTVLVGGCFDIIHYGHLQFLSQAKALGNHLIIALEPDEKILQAKKRAPIHSIEQRAAILAELRLVDEIVLLPVLRGYEEYLQLVTILKPVFIAVTEGDSQLENKRKQAEAAGSRLVVVTDHLETLSSSRIIVENAVYALDE